LRRERKRRERERERGREREREKERVKENKFFCVRYEKSLFAVTLVKSSIFVLSFKVEKSEVTCFA